jgi:5S rRNA maturation endonuclease (ribonuclease M5)
MSDRQALLASVDLEGLLESIGQARGLDRRGRQFPCPIADHDQTGLTPPAAVAPGPAGYKLWHCHTCQKGGSAIDALVLSGRADSVGEAFEQLGGNTSNGGKHNGRQRVIERYDYVSESGQPLFQVERKEPKGFRQRRRVGEEWRYDLGDTRKVLYHLPRLISAVKADEPIWIVEGERDVHALERAGAVATCNAMGAGKWLPEYSAFLEGADVVVVADRDDPGRKHAQAVEEALRGVARSVRVVRAVVGNDARDHLDAGHGFDEFVNVEEEQEQGHADARAVGGGVFVFDTPAEVTAIWGSGQEVFWASGEPLMIPAPPGVGKTTLAQQLVLRRIGLRRELLLGQPVAVGQKRVLYIAADRPQQAARSLRRMVREDEREALDERLTVWRGPLPFDLLKDLSQLATFTESHGADTLIIDSLKDIVMKLASDEVGSAVNMAIQECIARGIEVVSQHHQRKPSEGNREPRKLDDVYGSVWLTAGQGSVILLWGEAGDPIVRLRHLKSPAEEIGPLELEIDFDRGAIDIRRQSGLLGILRAAPEGLSVKDAAVELFGSAKVRPADLEKARRMLDKLVKSGLAVRVDQLLGLSESLYQAVTPCDPDRDPSRGGHAENGANAENPTATGDPGVTDFAHGGSRSETNPLSSKERGIRDPKTVTPESDPDPGAVTDEFTAELQRLKGGQS